MNREAIFSDGTSDYRIPCEPGKWEECRIVLRTAKGDVHLAYIRTREKRIPMAISGSDDVFDYFSATLRLEDKRIFYRFELFAHNEVVYYDRFGPSDDVRERYDFSITPGFSTPEWAKGAVMYQILVDRFCNGDESNDVCDGEYSYISSKVHHVKDWNRVPAEFDVCNFYGGDLEGFRQKLSSMRAF